MIDRAEVGDVPVLKMHCGLPDSQTFKYRGLLCFKRDWDFQDRQDASRDTEGEPRDDERRPTKKLKTKASKQRTLDDFLAGA